jgi:hypothetical protein
VFVLDELASGIACYAPGMRFLAFCLTLVGLLACRPTEPEYAMVEECLDCAGMCACTPRCYRDGSPAPIEACHDNGVYLQPAAKPPVVPVDGTAGPRDRVLPQR